MPNTDNGSGNSEATAPVAVVISGNLSSECAAVIARVCHEVNAAYCLVLGDQSQPSWSDAPPWQKDSAIAGVFFAIDNPDAALSAQHDSWMEMKLADGWVFGEVKDAEKKTHPCLVAFDALPPEQQMKDALFRAVVRSLAPPLHNFVEQVAELETELVDATGKLQAAETAIATLTAERDRLKAQAEARAKAPRATRSGEVGRKARKIGLVDGQPVGEDLLEAIGAADKVEIAFSDGLRELPLAPVTVAGDCWSIGLTGLQLRLPELLVIGLPDRPVKLGGYGLFLDDKLAAFAPRETYTIMPGQHVNLKDDVVFA